MASYKLVFKKSVAKDLRAIPTADLKRILSRITDLASNPRASDCIKLSGQYRYRVRLGVYRIIYEIQDGQLRVLVIAVGHRSMIYKSR
jgi:mRNA interferase RelE/StbE